MWIKMTVSSTPEFWSLIPNRTACATTSWCHSEPKFWNTRTIFSSSRVFVLFKTLRTSSCAITPKIPYIHIDSLWPLTHNLICSFVCPSERLPPELSKKKKQKKNLVLFWTLPACVCHMQSLKQQGALRVGGIVCVRNRLKQMCLWSKHKRSRKQDAGQTTCSVKGGILFVPSGKKKKSFRSDFASNCV